MSPTSGVSVGMLPSNRTLLVGVLQVVLPSLVLTLEQFPTADDPFTGTTSSVVAKEKLDGYTAEVYNITLTKTAIIISPCDSETVEIVTNSKSTVPSMPIIHILERTSSQTILCTQAHFKFIDVED